MEIFKKYKKKDRENEIKLKVNQILTSITEDKNNFNEEEQVGIMMMVCDRYREVKTDEMKQKYNKAVEIKNALNNLSVNSQIKIEFP